jgi:hypothetical protein
VNLSSDVLFCRGFTYTCLAKGLFGSKEILLGKRIINKKYICDSWEEIF